MRSIGLMLTLAILLTTPALWAQNGDHGKPQPEVWRHMDVPAAPPRTAEQELATFKVAPGFHVELVADDPMVQSPVAMAWDGAGRLWVVEMRAFMLDVDGHNENKPIGRVSVLEDTNHDGRMDKSTVFLDGLVMPRAIAVVPGGVLIGEPPHLLYCEVGPDLQCVKKTVVYNNYGKQGPVEHTENGLMYGLDNWLYNAKSLQRLQFRNGKITSTATIFRGQWGITQDDYGRIYDNSNSSFLHADLAPAHYLLRNPNVDPETTLNVGVVHDQHVFTVRVNPGVNRGYTKNQLRSDGRLSTCTATCGPCIYRGDQFPHEFESDAFIPEPAGNVVTHWKILDDGIRLSAKHVLYPDDKWGQREFLASTDERFRPVNAYTGPDGCLYIVDMYRGILQHRIYVTTYLRKQILFRHLDTPTNQGRIWRIVADKGKKPDYAAPTLDSATTDQLVAALSSPNGWTRDTAQRLLVENQKTDATDALKKLATTGDSPLGRIHALYTLSGLGGIDLPTVEAAFKHPNPQVRVAALRNADALCKASPAQMLKLIEAGAHDDSSAVQLQSLYSLGELPDSPEDVAAIADLAERHVDDSVFRDAALSSVPGRSVKLLEALLAKSSFSSGSAGRESMLKVLGEATWNERRTDICNAMLGVVAAQPASRAWVQIALLQGIINTSRHPHPLLFNREPVALAKIAAASSSKVVKQLKKAEAYITWPGDKSKPWMANIHPLTPEQQVMFQKGREIYSETCFGCHQPNGRGMPGLAPPLVDSPYVLGSDARLARIILDGLTGPVKVNGRQFDLSMPGHFAHPLIAGDGLANVMTYIRREWGHTASPVSAERAAELRKAVGTRVEPWTAAELAKIK